MDATAQVNGMAALLDLARAVAQPQPGTGAVVTAPDAASIPLAVQALNQAALVARYVSVPSACVSIHSK